MINLSNIEIAFWVVFIVIIAFVILMKYAFEMMDHDSIKLFEKDTKRILKASTNSDAFDRTIMIDFWEHDEIPLSAAKEMIAAKLQRVDSKHNKAVCHE